MEEEKTKKDIKDMSLDEKILELKKEVLIMQKNAKGYDYTYVTEESILLKINDKMLELGLKLIPRFKNGTLKSEIVNYKNSKGQDKLDILVTSEMQFVWKDIYSKEEEVIDWALVGQQGDGSQALGSGLTYSNRYFLLKYFNIATSNDDPDKIKSEQLKKQQEEEQAKKMNASQTKIKKLFSECVTKFGGNRQVYEKLGTTADNFSKDFKDVSKQDTLIEQMNLILKEDTNA